MSRWTCPKCARVMVNVGGHPRKCGLTAQEIFWSRVEKSDGCWIWTGAKENHGYGHFRPHSVDYRAHRYSYMLANGPIPTGMHVLHSCDVYACVNPAHLRIGSHRENMADAKAKGRNTRGEKGRSAKLTEAAVLAIRREVVLGQGGNRRTLAKKYGVGPNTIWNAAVGNTWAYLPGAV